MKELRRRSERHSLAILAAWALLSCTPAGFCGQELASAEVKEKRAGSSEMFGLASVKKQFEARALTAADRLAKLTDELKDAVPNEAPEQNLVLGKVCLESAYLAHLSDKGIVQKPVANPTSFHLILNGGEEAGILDLVYQFSEKGELISVQLHEIPRKWRVVLKPKYILVASPSDCLYRFSLTDPFDTQVLDLIEAGLLLSRE